MNTLYFFFSTGVWLSATMVVRSKNPVHSVFYLVLLFCNASGLLFMLGLEFFALLNIYVYVGALAVMFLFVVMLLDITYTEIVAHQRGYYPIAVLFVLGLIFGFYLYDQALSPAAEQWIRQVGTTTESQPDFIKLLKDSGAVLNSSNWEYTLAGGSLLDNNLYNSWHSLSYQIDNMKALAPALYIHYVDLLLIASLILLVAMIGAVVLTLKKRQSVPLQDIFAQHNRDFQKVVSTIKREKNYI